jgi:hypothetical protein
MRILCLITLFLFALPGVTAEKAYKIVHPDGTVEYSDQPAEGGEEIRIQKAPTTKMEKAPALDTRPDKESNQQDIPDYTLTITSPTNDETIRDNTGNVTLSGLVSPSLRGIHRLRWSMDGNALSQTGVSVSLENVDRGSHTVRLEVVDLNGNVLTASEPVTFHLIRVSTIPPANPAPNFPKPKPKAPTP